MARTASSPTPSLKVTNMTALAVNIAASNIQGLLLGIFIALTITSLSLLWNRRWKEVSVHDTGSRSNRSLFATTRGMWTSTLVVLTTFFVVIVTTHWILGVCRMFDAVVYYDHGASAEAYYANLRHPLEVSRTALLILSKLTGDLILTYRMWIVWNRRYAIAIPAVMTSLGLLVSGIGVTYQFTTKESSEGFFSKKISQWVIGVVVATLMTELYGTAMISYRMYMVNASLKHNGLKRASGGILEIMGIFVESSMLSTSGTLFFVFAYASKSELEALATTCMPAIHGIAFVLITVRVGLGWDLKVHATQPGSEDTQASTLSPSQAYPLRGLRLMVSTTTHQEVDFALPQQSRRSSDTVLNIHKD